MTVSAYITLNDLRQYLTSAQFTMSTGDDALLGTIIQAAQSQVEVYCDRYFAGSVGTRTYNRYVAAIRNQALYLDEDLQSVVTLVNGNAQTVPSGSAWLEPMNWPPYGLIRLQSSYVWTFNTDGVISVAGTWGYSLTPPADIVQATKRLAAYHYRNRDAQVFDVTASPELGVITIPKGIPADVKQILDDYRKQPLMTGF